MAGTPLDRDEAGGASGGRVGPGVDDHVDPDERAEVDADATRDLTSDPRMTGEYLRRIVGEGDAGTVTLVGVVHGHPASAYRVRRAVERFDPDVLALELPPLAVPLVTRRAQEDPGPREVEGEMAGAVRAADVEAVVGIDGPSVAFLARLAVDIRRHRPGIGTVRRVLRNTIAMSREAVAWRAAATVAVGTPLRLAGVDPVGQGTDRTERPDPPDPPASPAAQARDERVQIRRSRSFMRAFRDAAPTRATGFVDATREDHMAARLRSLRRDGDVLAVVGIDHLDPLVERLAEP